MKFFDNNSIPQFVLLSDPASKCRSQSLFNSEHLTVLTITQASVFLALTKLLVGAGSLSAAAYIFFQWFNRRDPKQYLRIYTKLTKPLEIDVDTSRITLERHAETRFLQQFFSSPPSGIVIVVGPSGSGKSQVMKQVLQGRKMAIYVDFKKDPILTGEEFMFNFVEHTGYHLFVPSDFTRLFFRDEVRKSRITAQEAEKTLSLLRRILHEEKRKGWPNGVPIICLDDYHRVFRSSGDVYFSKFLDWCLHIEEAKLAHVVFVTSFSFAHLDLDAHPHIRSKRLILYVDYPSNQSIKEYLSKFSSSLNEPLTPTQIDWIVKCIGGSMEDLDQVITALSRGDSYANILRRMVTDSISFVEDHLEKILQQASDLTDESKKEQVYGKYLRFWSMMEALRDKESVNRRDMIRLIFKEHAKELEDYIAAEIICYRNQKKEYIKTPTQTTTVGATTSGTLSSQTSTSGPSTTTTTTTTTATSSTQQQSVTAEQKKSGESVKQSGESEPKQKTTADPEAAIYTSLLNESLDSVLVSSGSPRLRVAFDVLLNDRRMHEQKQWVEFQLKSKKINDKINSLEDKRRLLLKDREQCVTELTQLIMNAPKWKEEFTKEEFTSRKESILAREERIEAALKNIEDQLDEWIRKRDELQLQQTAIASFNNSKQ